jgi:hypothetical protein
MILETEVAIPKEMEMFPVPIDESNRAPIFVVTALMARGETVEAKECLGWFPTYSEAEEVLLDNDGPLLEEGNFNMAVIAELPSGIRQTPVKQQFYELVTDRVVKTRLVPEALLMTSFALT